MTYLLLFYEFFKTGLFAVGGGLATLPFIYDIAVRYPGWINMNDISNMIAVSESTPGPMGVNMATFTGFTTSGVFGALSATIGLVVPSVIIIIIIAHYLKKFEESQIVQDIFYGLRPAVAGLIAVAAYQVIKVTILTLDLYNETKNLMNLVDIKALILCAVTLVLLYVKPLKKVHPIVYILCGAIIGIFIF